MIFGPTLIQLFAPGLALIATLITHFKESKDQPIGKRYIFVPAALFSAVAFVSAQSILSIWILVLSFMIWVSVIGFFFTFVAFFLFGLAPFAIITAPFIVWYKVGFAGFLATALFFLIALCWNGFSKLAFPADYWKRTPDDFLGYSPQTFLLGVLSFQVIAMPFYRFGFNGVGTFISDYLGTIFLLLALVAAFKWRSIKKKLSLDEKNELYKPSVWVYICGFLLTNLLYGEYQQSYDAPTAILAWLSIIFLVVLIGRFFGIFKRKKQKESQLVKQEQEIL